MTGKITSYFSDKNLVAIGLSFLFAALKTPMHTHYELRQDEIFFSHCTLIVFRSMEDANSTSFKLIKTFSFFQSQVESKFGAFPEPIISARSSWKLFNDKSNLVHVGR